MDVFGPSQGIDDLGPVKLTNEFRGIRDQSIDSMVISNRVLPRNLSSGVMQGEQNLDDKSVQVQASKGRIFFQNDDGQEMSVGKAPDGNLAVVITKDGTSVESVFS